MKPSTGQARRVALVLLVLLALAAVFAAYLEPELAVDLAARVWACF